MRKKSNGTAPAGQPSSRVEINKSRQQTTVAPEHPVRTGIGVTAQPKLGPRSLMKTSGLATRGTPIRRPGTAGLSHTARHTHALQVLEMDARFDVIVTDYAMPGMTGLELAKRIKLKHPRMPIVIATGYAELPPHATLGFPRLSKPYTQQQLAEAIESASRLAPRSSETTEQT
jgi:CheY-like chemotaxis protein